MLDFNHSLRKAHISLVVMAITLVGGTVLIGRDPTDAELQAVAMTAFAAAFVCLFTLYRREERAAELAARRSRDADLASSDEAD